MSSETLVARSPIVDWTTGFERRWNAGDAASTHAFNALSFLFPQAESYFIEVVRDVQRRIDLAGDRGVTRAVGAFVAQESIHARQHALYNAVLASQGFSNVAANWIDRQQARSWRGMSPLTRLAVVCSYEHYTATLGAFLLRNPEVLANAPPDLALVWGWHAAEESEHKSVCFDLYRAAGGPRGRRVLAHLAVTANFAFMFSWLYASLLARDGALRPRALCATLIGTTRFFLGRKGVVWAVVRGFVRYLHPGFHPWNDDNAEAVRAWFSARGARLRILQ